MVVIDVYRDPYDSGFTPTRPAKIELNPGLTVLVGCNGAGKTTLIRNIEEEAKKKHLPVHKYNNLSDGGSSSIGDIFSGFSNIEGDNTALGVALLTASEGEAIRININRQSRIYNDFLEKGIANTRQNLPLYAFGAGKETFDTNIRILLFDATDSGVSIDSICDLKAFFHSVLETSEEKGVELYIIISANEYELCRNEQCFDVNNGKYITFESYEEYRNFILKSREKKEKRIDRQIKWAEKQRIKEQEKFENFKKKTILKIENIKKAAKEDGRELGFLEERNIQCLEREIEDFKIRCGFI